MSLLVYIAGPLTGKNQHLNLYNAVIAGKKIRDAGYAVFIPHRARNLAEDERQLKMFGEIDKILKVKCLPEIKFR